MIEPLELAQHIAAGALLATVDGVEYRAVHLVGYLGDGAEPHIYCPIPAWPQSQIGRLAERDRYIAELEATLSGQADEVLRSHQRIAELEQLLKAAESGQREEQVQATRLMARIDGLPDIPPAVAAAATGMPQEEPSAQAVSCPEPGCGRTFPSAQALATHRTRTHDATIRPSPPRVMCGVDGCKELCFAGPQLKGHRKRTHPDWYAEMLALPHSDPRKIALGQALPPALGEEEEERPQPIAAGVEPPWRCVLCLKDTFACDLHDPTRCIRCAKTAQSIATNGQAVAA